jgi:dihydrodipicolinate synthase/N-acetylneuraminate lyase
MKPRFITAIATPLERDDTLHREALEMHIRAQLQAGIAGLLIGGTMGAMQLLTDDVYRDLFTQSIALARGRCELLGGAGDTSFGRTRDRIAFLNDLPLDGVVVLPPFFIHYSQNELIDYYHLLAQESRHPLFLYDQPAITRCKLEMETVVRLAQHPNIRGIKCSDEPSYARQLIDRCADDFRVILAAPLLIDVFLRYGVMEHLDGVYCLCPRQIVDLGRACAFGHWDTAADLQQGVNRVTRLLRAHGIWQTFTALMNALGIPGRFRARPHLQWGERETDLFLENAETQAVLRFLQSASVPAAEVAAGA